MLKFNTNVPFRINDNKLSNNVYLNLNNKEYLPLFLMNKKWRTSPVAQSYENLIVLNNVYPFFNVENYKYPESLENKYYAINLRDNAAFVGNNNLKLNSRKIVEYTKDNIKSYIYTIDFKLKENYITSSLTTYEQFFSAINEFNCFNKIKFINNEYLCNFGFLADFNNTFKPLFSIMVKQENMKYLKLCHITNTPVNNSVLEFWVDKCLLTDIKYKNLKIMFNKTLKLKLVEQKIKIIEVDDLFNYSFNTIEVPAFKTIKDKKEFEINVLDNFLNDSKIVETMSNNNIVLT